MGLRVNLQEQVSTFPSPTLSDTTTVVNHYLGTVAADILFL